MASVALARALGRSRRTVRAAIARGAIPMVRRLPSGECVVRVTPTQLACWRARSFPEVLATARLATPSLPAAEQEWRSVDDLARAYGLTQSVVLRTAARIRVPLLTWDADGPFRPQRRLWEPAFYRARLRTRSPVHP